MLNRRTLIISFTFFIFILILTNISLSDTIIKLEHYVVCEVGEEDIEDEEVDDELEQIDEVICAYFHERQSEPNIQEINLDGHRTREILEQTNLSYDYLSDFKINGYYRFSFRINLFEGEGISAYIRGLIYNGEFFEDANIVESDGELEQALTEEFLEEMETVRKEREYTFMTTLITELFIILFNIFLIAGMFILLIFRKPKPKDRLLSPDWRKLALFIIPLFLWFSVVVGSTYNVWTTAPGPDSVLTAARIPIIINAYLGLLSLVIIRGIFGIGLTGVFVYNVPSFIWLIVFYLFSCSTVRIIDRLLKR